MASTKFEKVCTSIPKQLHADVKQLARRSGTHMSKIYSLGASLVLVNHGRLSPHLRLLVEQPIQEYIAHLEARIAELAPERKALDEVKP